MIPPHSLYQPLMVAPCAVPHQSVGKVQRAVLQPQGRDTCALPPSTDLVLNNTALLHGHSHSSLFFNNSIG